MRPEKTEGLSYRVERSLFQSQSPGVKIRLVVRRKILLGSRDRSRWPVWLTGTRQDIYRGRHERRNCNMILCLYTTALYNFFNVEKSTLLVPLCYTHFYIGQIISDYRYLNCQSF